MHKDNLAWVDEEYKAERKALLKPTPEQEGMAHMLEHDLGGGYVLFGTGTFRPNQYEEIIQHKEGDKKDQFTRKLVFFVTLLVLNNLFVLVGPKCAGTK